MKTLRHHIVVPEIPALTKIVKEIQNKIPREGLLGKIAGLNSHTISRTKAIEALNEWLGGNPTGRYMHPTTKRGIEASLFRLSIFLHAYNVPENQLTELRSSLRDYNFQYPPLDNH